MATRRAVKASPQKKATNSKTRRPVKRNVKRTGGSAAAAPARAGATASKRAGPALNKAVAPPIADAEDRNSRFDPRTDRRIIEGMLHDRETLMTEMGQKGIGAASVIRRAAELGLSEALIRQVKGVAADLAGERPGRKSAPSSLGARTCLCCDRVFLSAGPGNRLCMRCRGGDAGLAQL